MIAEGKLPAHVPTDFGYVTDAAQKEAQEKLARLVPNAKHIANTNSGHEIHKEQPQLVINAREARYRIINFNGLESEEGLARGTDRHQYGSRGDMVATILIWRCSGPAGSRYESLNLLVPPPRLERGTSRSTIQNCRFCNISISSLPAR